MNTRSAPVRPSSQPAASASTASSSASSQSAGQVRTAIAQMRGPGGQPVFVRVPVIVDSFGQMRIVGQPQPLSVGGSGASSASSQAPSTTGFHVVASGNSALIPSKPFAQSPYVPTVLADLAQKSQRGVASQTYVMPEDPAALEKYAFAYEANTVRNNQVVPNYPPLAKEANLIKTPANGKLNFSVLINVSGHNGQQKAKEYANDPKQGFEIEVKYPDGKREHIHLDKPAGEGEAYAIAQQLSLDVTQKGTYEISGWPTGSAGVGGYVEGRLYKLHVGQENFYKPVYPSAADQALIDQHNQQLRAQDPRAQVHGSTAPMRER